MRTRRNPPEQDRPIERLVLHLPLPIREPEHKKKDDANEKPSRGVALIDFYIG